MRALVLALAALLACRGDNRDTTPHNIAPAVALQPARVPAPIATPTGPSLYSIALPLRAADGRTIAFDVDRGHPTVISMFYGSCSIACPAMIGYLQQLLTTSASDARVLLVSFDAAHDTPQRLRELTEAHHLDARFTLASASPDDARTLAALLDFKYRPTTNGEFVHNAVITVLDREGRKVTALNGLGDPAQLVSALSGLVPTH